ncbi:hypothetical protein [Desulfoluna sp.]|uniref:hypothetical protein n=1 Tax=Desulfoluna sp. TaxID=2045199 RepID=UPI0026163602|nr:hypothetical protein [Desulfoluna sp.]
MSGDAIFQIIFGLVIAAVIACVAVFILRKLKGSLKIVMARTSFDSGSDIEGQIIVKTNKETHGNFLSVALVADEITTRYEDDERKTDTREVYRDQYELEGSRAYPAGHEASHDFKLPIPAMDNMETPLGKAISSFAQSFGSRQSRVEWTVESRLDATGVDLVVKKIVSVR